MITGQLRDRLSRDRTRLASEESERSEHSFDPNNAFLASPRSQLQLLPNLRPDQPTSQAQAQTQAQQTTPIQDQILAVLNQLLQNQQRQHSEPAQPVRQPETLQPQLLQPQPPLPPLRQPHTGGYPFRPQEAQQFQPQYQQPPKREHLQSRREYPQYAEPLRHRERPQSRDNEPIQEPITGPLYTREITTIGKMYNDDQKYDGIGDSFDFKLSIFYDICRRCGLLPDGYMIAFPNMLKGLALSYYYSCNLSTKSFEIACESMRNFFEGPEYYRKNLTE